MTELTLTEQIITVAAVIAGTMVTRFLPFLLFPVDKKTPPLVDFLGKLLPPAIMGMLVIYSLKDIQLLSGNHGIPEISGCLFTILAQVLTRSLLVAISAGTIGYMILVQYIFV